MGGRARWAILGHTDGPGGNPMTELPSRDAPVPAGTAGRQVA